jgi:plasmanylethanolamine desaturase
MAIGDKCDLYKNSFTAISRCDRKECMSLLPLFVTAGTAALVVMLADFVTGVVHWAEDAYAAHAKPGSVWRKVADANALHHTKPRAFLVNTWFESSWDLLLLASAISALAFAFGQFNWATALFALIVANANQLHKWTHRNHTENPRVIVWLQKLRLLQTVRHHARHHTGERNSHYCVVTNWLNPLLERLEFWRRLERFNARVFGLRVAVT